MAQKGFTLLELMVVLTILALATALIPPFLAGGRAAAEFKTSVRDIASALRDARAKAVDRNRSEVFWIDVATGHYRVGNQGAVHAVPNSVRLSLLTVSDERLDEETAGIRFFPDGSSTGGRVSFVQGKKRSDVLIDWLTGQISTRNVATPAEG